MKKRFLKKPIKVSFIVILLFVLTLVIIPSNASAATPPIGATHARASSATRPVPDPHLPSSCGQRGYSSQGPLPYGWMYLMGIEQYTCSQGPREASIYAFASTAGQYPYAAGWDESIKLWDYDPYIGSTTILAQAYSSGNGLYLPQTTIVCGQTYHFEFDSWFSGFPWIAYTIVNTPAFSIC